LARNGAGSEPVPALPLPAMPEKQVMYLNDGVHQPLCNKLKRLGITCIFVAAKVSPRLIHRHSIGRGEGRGLDMVPSTTRSASLFRGDGGSSSHRPRFESTGDFCGALVWG
jgi:hypothetical protein